MFTKALLTTVLVVLWSSAFVSAQACVPFNGTITTECTSADLSQQFPACARYISYTSILTTSLTPLPALLFLAQQSLSAVPAGLPEQCSDPLKEIICKTIFSECVPIQVPVAPGVEITISLPRAPCTDICTKATRGCSQLFSFAGQAPPDCNQLSPVSCQPVFVDVATTYPQLGGLSIPCQPSSLPTYPKGPFYCEKFLGKPSTCTKYLGKGDHINFNYILDQDSAAQQAQATLEQFAALPDSCRFQAEEFVCRNFFRECQTYIASSELPTDYHWGKAICRSGCNDFNVQCGELFGLQGVNLTDCKGITPALENNPSYPPKSQIFHLPPLPFPTNDAMAVPCRESDLKNQPKTFRCEKWTGQPSQCSPYLKKNNGTKDVFILDAFNMETRVNLTITFVAILKDLPKNCRDYATEMICRTIFQECESFNDDDLPTTYYVGKPPCKSICKNVRGCEKELKKVGIPIPDCGEIDSLTGGQVYPKRHTKLLVPDHSYSVSCINSIHSSGNNRRFARGVEEPETTFEEEQIEEDEDRGEYEYDPEQASSNTFNIAMSIAQALSSVSGVDHQSSAISGLQADGAFDNLIRSVSERVARRVFV